MNWKSTFITLFSAICAACLVFVGQLIFDTGYFSNSHAADVSVASDIQSPFSDGPPYVWTYSLDGRRLGTPYFQADGKPAYPNLKEPNEFYPARDQVRQWRNLWYQLVLLDWLQQRGLHAGQIAAWTALATAWFIFLFNSVQTRTKAKLAN